MIKQNNARGITLMVLAMGAFAIADTLIKTAAGVISPAQVMFLIVAGGLVAFALIGKIQGQSLVDSRVFAPVLLMRYLAEIVGMVGMVLALAFVPLSTVGAILQATPLLVAIGAVLFLGEKVSWRRWTAIIIGFLGVLLIIQPAGDQFDATVLWAVMSMVGLSIRDLTTRMTPPDMASTSLATFTMAAALPFATIWVVLGGDGFLPENANWLLVVSMVGLGSMGYMLLIASIRMAEVSIVSPFRYTRLIFLLIFGVVIFDERPGFATLSGALLIVVSGIYMMWRERQTK